MKTFDYFSKFKYFIIALLVVTVLGMVVLGIFGFNKSADYGKAYEVRIVAEDAFKANNAKIKKTADKVFTKNNVSYVLTKDVDDGNTVIYQFVNKVDGAVITELQTAIDEVFSTSTVDAVVTQYETYGNRSNSEIWLAILAVGILFVIEFLYVFFRNSLAAALSCVITGAITAVLEVALVALTRVPVTAYTLPIAVFVVIYSLAYSIYFNAIVKEESKVAEQKGLAPSSHVNSAFNKTLLNGALVFALVALVSLALIILGGTIVKYVGLALLVCALAGAFTSCFISGGFYALLKKKK